MANPGHDIVGGEGIRSSSLRQSTYNQGLVFSFPKAYMEGQADPVVKSIVGDLEFFMAYRLIGVASITKGLSLTAQENPWDYP